MMAKQNTTASVTIQVDCDGTELGKFNDDGDPIVSCHRLTNEWMLAFKTNTGTACASLDVSGRDAATEAVTAAREHLNAHQAPAATRQGS